MLATRPASDTIAIARTFDGVEGAAHRVIERSGGSKEIRSHLQAQGKIRERTERTERIV